MIETNGKFLNETILSLGLKGDDRTQAISNAEHIIEKLVDSYEQVIGDMLGKMGKGFQRIFHIKMQVQ